MYDDPGLGHFGPAVRWWLNVDWAGAENIFSVCEFLGEWDPVVPSSSSHWLQSDNKINVKSKSKNEELIISGAFTLIKKNIQTKETVNITPYLKHKFHIVLEVDDKIWSKHNRTMLTSPHLCCFYLHILVVVKYLWGSEVTEFDDMNLKMPTINPIVNFFFIL